MSSDTPHQTRSRNKTLLTGAADLDIGRIEQGVKNLVVDTAEATVGAKHRRTLSQEEEACAHLEQAVGSVRKARKYLRDAGSGGDRLEGVDAVETLLEDIKNIIHAVDSYKRQDNRKGWTVLAVSLSKLTREDIDRMGLRLLVEIQRKDFKKLISKLSPALKKWDAQPLTDSVSLVRWHTGGPTESRRRMLIDLYIIAAAQLLHDDLDHVIIIFPELTLATDGERAVFEDPGSSTAILVSGRTDYFVATVSLKALTREAGRLLEQARVSATYRSFRENLVGNKSFLVIEAKKGDQALEKHLPQAIGEAMVVLRLDSAWLVPDSAQNPPQHQIAVILTNGDEWIFGLVVRTGSTYRCHVSSKFSEEKDGVAELFKFFVIWTITPASQIQDKLGIKDSEYAATMQSQKQ